MKRIVSIALALLLVFGLLAGCSSSADDEETEAPAETEEATDTATEAPTEEPEDEDEPEDEEEEEAGLSGTVSTNGSTSVESVMAALIESFGADNPGIEITYDGTGSSAGIQAALEGTTDIGLSSRALKDEEVEDGLIGTVFALDGIAIVVHPDNPIDDLSIDDIAALATGQVENWTEVGGDDQPVVFIGREAGSGTRDGFESIVGVADECVYDQEQTSTGAVLAAVASNENAIGYISLASVSDEIKVLSVAGVEPSEETVLDGTYEIQRPFVLVTSEDQSLSEEAQAFFDFILSSDAAEIISNAGAVQP